MIEKIFSLEHLKLSELGFNNKDFQKISESLNKLGFFHEEKGKKEIPCKKVFSILRKAPDHKNHIGGQNYIIETYFENEKPISAKTYDFNLKITSSCS